MNWRSKRSVLLLIAVVAVAMMLAGGFAAYVNRHHTLCADGKPPVRQRGGLIGQTEYQCHDGSTVTTS
jgi:hypothetical protein